MTTSAPVPADVEPESIIDLVDDCREVTGVLGALHVDLTAPPLPRTAAPVDISAGTAAALDGYGEYGA